MLKQKIIRGKISKGIVENLKKQQCSKCNICGFNLEEGKYHIEHIKPLSEGGNDNDINNLQIICIECHIKKHNKKPKLNLQKNMFNKTCNVCGRVIAGFTQKHVDTLMAQHMIKHQNEDREKEKNKNAKS